MTKIYFDENIPEDLVRGLQHLDRPLGKMGELELLYLPDYLKSGVKDEDWIPILGAEASIVITHDFNIHRRIDQRVLYQKSGLSIIFIAPPSKSGYLYWELVQQMVRRWSDIRKIVSREKRPFALKYTSKKNEPEKL